MTQVFSITFASLDDKPETNVAFLIEPDLKLTKSAKTLDPKSSTIERAIKVAKFKGKSKSAFDLLAPAGAKGIDRIIGIGIGKVGQYNSNDWITIGGYLGGKLAACKCEAASVLADVSGVSKKASAQLAADLALGMLLRGYKYDAFKTKKNADQNDANGNGNNGSDNGDEDPQQVAIKIHCQDPKAATTAFVRAEAIAEGVCLARDLVNAPANVLGPAEFADRAKTLEDVGIEVNILDERAMEAYGMNALLSVGHGSAKPCRMVVMNWWGSKSKRGAPIAFVGKGVTFDTGGISLKPAKGMEDMKGDMGGAACVTGLMHALAARKAPVNAVGIIGLVENMPGAQATRPGDIVTSASGKTIEILNTDAEGRLVLADCLWYAEKEVNPRPKAIIDLATLTGAIMVALGQEYAGMFSNDDKLAGMLSEAGEATGELVWRMPLSKKYDAMINSRNADMKNIGGRFAGATTAAQFLQRFVTDTPWAHLDIAGTAMSSPRSEINQSWGAGFGVRLLNQLVEDSYEK